MIRTMPGIQISPPASEQSKIFIEKARQMHEQNPSIPIGECLRIIIERDKKNEARKNKR